MTRQQVSNQPATTDLQLGLSNVGTELTSPADSVISHNGELRVRNVSTARIPSQLPLQTHTLTPGTLIVYTATGKWFRILELLRLRANKLITGVQ